MSVSGSGKKPSRRATPGTAPNHRESKQPKGKSPNKKARAPRGNGRQGSRTSNSRPERAQAPRRTAASAEAFPIVGLGASAGGLAALEAFFEHVPKDCGLAFVVVTHQHPKSHSMLPELLARKTSMSVAQVETTTRVEVNHVYTVRPGYNIGILDGVLQPVLTDARPQPPMPIDYFFRSLAQDQKEHAVGIVLSGTGSDGSLGLKEIKGELGMVMVQDEATAEYTGMPHAAIATEVVDYVLPAAEMPKQLLAYVAASMPGREHAIPTDTLPDRGARREARVVPHAHLALSDDRQRHRWTGAHLRRRQQAQAPAKRTDPHARGPGQLASKRVCGRPRVSFTWVCSLAFGKAGSELVGKLESELFQPEDVKRLAQLKQRVLTTAAAHRQQVPLSWNGSRRTYDFFVEPRRERAGEVTGFTFVVTDVTPSS